MYKLTGFRLVGFVSIRVTQSKRSENLPRRLSLPFMLEEGRVPGMISRLLYVSSGLIAALVIWASITEIRELAIASGQLQPVGSVQVLQHLEGGIVSEILVEEGQVVEAGAPLVRLQPAAAGSDLAQVRVRVAALMLQVERQSASLEGRQPQFDELIPEFPELVQHQMDLYQSSLVQLNQQKDSLISRVEQRFAEVQAFHARLESLEAQLRIDREQVEIRAQLLEEQYVSRSVYLDSQRTYERTNADTIEVRGELQSAQESLNEARINLLEVETDFRNTLTEERAVAAAELAELDQSVIKQEDRVSRLLVIAPVRGVVQELVPTAIGQVIRPGEIVAQVVPMDQELVAEVRIDPTDIGHVEIGHNADVKVTTFDAARFGSLSGIVRHISASTFQNEEGDPYYRAVIELATNYVGSGDMQHQVLPGMVVNAEIVTGSKSLVRYLLKPVFRAIDLAFIER